MAARWNAWGPVPLRLMLGLGFMYHGYPKLFDQAAREGFVVMLQGIGVPVPGIAAWGVGIVEFFGGLAIVLGAWTVIAAILGIVDMAVAAWTVHRDAGFDFLNIEAMGATGPEYGVPGYEVNLLYIAGFLALIVGGAGALSVDAARGGRRRPGRGGTLR